MDTRRRLGFTLAVAGASGGLGASSLAAALATRAAKAGHESVLVDIDPVGGADVLLGCEMEPGPRWRELLGAVGSVDGEALLTRLPRSADSVAVLSGDRGYVNVPPEVIAAVRPALAGAVDVCVLDVGRSMPEWVSAIDALLLVVGGTVPALSAAQVACDRVLQLGGRPWLVLREVEDRLAPTVAEALEAPVLARLRGDSRLAHDLQIGRAPGARERSPLARCADEMLRTLLVERQVA